jgi:hypothetical protein
LPDLNGNLKVVDLPRLGIQRRQADPLLQAVERGLPVDAEVMRAWRKGISKIGVAVVGSHPLAVHANAGGNFTADTESHVLESFNKDDLRASRIGGAPV